MKREMGPELLALRERVERWRRARPSRTERIPEEIWDEAVGIVQIEGLHATASALRFEYYALKKHVDRVGGGSALATVSDSGAQASPEPTFVQVQLPRHPAGGLVIELTARGGDRMRIESGDAAQVDVVGMVHAFWSRAS
jgi:hypothetical protein